MPTGTSAPLQRLRTGLAVLGAAALLVGGVNVVAQAADGAQALLVGKSNKAEKTTKLKNKGKGPALELKAKKGPALSVNTTDLIKNLNAATVDGKTASQLAPAITSYILPSGPSFTPGANFQQFQLAAGTYELNLNVALQTTNSSYLLGCLVSDASLFPALTDSTKVYAGFNITNESPTQLADSTRIITLTSATNVAYGCVLSTSDTEPVSVVHPFTLVVQQISGNLQGSSTPLPVTLKQARAAVAGR